MGNYAVAADIRNRFDGAGLTDELVGDLCKSANVTVQNTFMESQITMAEGLIDAYLNKHYDTPIVTDQSNGFLQELTCDLAEYNIWKRSLGDDVPTKIKDAWKQALEHLKMIIEGKLSPFGTDGSKNSSLDIDSDVSRMDEDSLQYF